MDFSNEFCAGKKTEEIPPKPKICNFSAFCQTLSSKPHFSNTTVKNTVFFCFWECINYVPFVIFQEAIVNLRGSAHAQQKKRCSDIFSNLFCILFDFLLKLTCTRKIILWYKYGKIFEVFLIFFFLLFMFSAFFFCIHWSVICSFKVKITFTFRSKYQKKFFNQVIINKEDVSFSEEDRPAFKKNKVCQFSKNDVVVFYVYIIDEIALHVLNYL